MRSLRPETLRVQAACEEHRARLGELPSAEVVLALAAHEGADPDACLALVRYELRDRQGRIWSLDMRGPSVVLTNVEVVRAVLKHRREPKAALLFPHGRYVKRGHLELVLKAWEMCEDMAEGRA